MRAAASTALLEREVLGGMLLDDRVLAELRVPPDQFYDDRAGVVLGAALALHQRGDRVTLSGLTAELERSKQLDVVGRDYLATLAKQAVPISTATVDRLHELVELRRIRLQADVIRKSCDDSNLEAAREGVYLLAQEDYGFGSEPRRIRDLAVDAARKVVLSARAGEAPGIDFGVDWLRRSVGGIRPGQMAVFGAPTGIGKSSLALEVAKGASRKVPVGLISCEDNEDVIGERYVGAMTNIGPREMQGLLDDRQVEYLERASQAFHDADVWCDFKIGGRDTDVLASMRRMVNAYGCKLLIVDYLQTIRSSFNGDRKDQVREMCALFKGQAHALGVPLIMVSQFSRPPKEALRKWEPNIHSLKESGDVENAAEVIVLLWGELNEQGDETGRINAKIGKCKWGYREGRTRFARTEGGCLVEVSMHRDGAF